MTINASSDIKFIKDMLLSFTVLTEVTATIG